jgi:hypothetical protein
LYGCETESFTLRKEHRLKESENGAMKRILGTKREEQRGWRKLQNEELHILYPSLNIMIIILM